MNTTDGLVRKDDTRFMANVVLTPLRDEAGTLHGFTTVMCDVTVRKRVEQ